MTRRPVIRKCRSEDVRALEWEGLFTHHREILERTYREQLHGEQVMLVADLDGALVGQVWVDLRSERHRDTAMIWALRTRPSHERCGVATQLLAAAEAIAREHGFRATELAAEVANTRARRLYQRRGYNSTERVTQTYSYTTPDGVFCQHCLDLIKMRKVLQPVRRSPVVRWTIGNVSPSGFEVLRLSVWGAYRLFGPSATFVICLNSVPLADAMRLTGDLPAGVEWCCVTREDIAGFIRPHLDDDLAEGVGWKFAPVRLFTNRAELALDNDLVLWEMPQALARWLDDDQPTCVLAEDVRACFGQFAALCGPAPRNAGLRAIPRGYDLEARMRTALARVPVVMRSELDEQGLQVAAVSLDGEPDVVEIEEVSICSPFPPHLPNLGRCGAHFVGVNARSLPWSYQGRPAVAHLQAHWSHWRDEVARRVGL